MRISTSLTRMLGIGLTAALLASASQPAFSQNTHPQIDFATGSPTGGWYPIGAKLADLVNQYYEGQPVSVVPGGGVGNVARVGSGQAGLGISYGSFLKLAQQGGNELYQEKFPKVRAVGALLPTVLHLIATPDSGIETTADLAGSAGTIATGTNGSGELFMLDQIFKAHGGDLQNREGRVDLMQTGGRVDAWRNGQTDIANFFLNTPAASVVEALSARKGVWVEVSEEARDALARDYGYLSYTIPSGTYPGIEEDVEAMGAPMVIFANADVDEELVYQLTKAMAEGREQLLTVNSAFAEWNPEDLPEGVVVELHPGAARYYKERGWTE